MATEKLIVKNFGPIREADLDLKKVTVFIGEQASGKSVLAKLVAMFSEKPIYNSKDLSQILKDYNIAQYDSDKATYRLKDSTHSNIFEDIQITSLSGKNKSQIIKEKEDKILKSKNSIYIPTERILISLIAESLFGFITSDISLPKFLVNFGNEVEKARKELKSFNIENLNLEYSFRNNRDTITYNKTKSLLVESSSGLQSLLPLLLVIERYYANKEKEKFLFITEEPELNLYPTTQQKLVKYLIEKCTQGDNRLIITTHSPYILTALNNLIQAKNVVNKNPEMASEVNAIVPPQCQIDFEDVAAYFVADGTARSIMNADNQLIDANALDEVSNDINEEFSKLVQLEYQNEVL